MGLRREVQASIDGAPQLSTPFADFVMLGENAIHGADRAQIDALVEQAGVDFGWSQINKPRLPQQVEYDLALFRDKRPHWRWPRAPGPVPAHRLKEWRRPPGALPSRMRGSWWGLSPAECEVCREDLC